MANYARIENHQAYLNTRFGLTMAMGWMGLDLNMLEAIVGRYSRGKRKGQLRGSIAWKKTVRGGWVSEDGYGHVEFPGIQKESFKLIDSFTGQEL